MTKKTQNHLEDKTPADVSRNNLDRESSPYLLQHAGNPVWWQPWDKATFAAAKAADKPVFLSIGYATCHWCHVMEGDSFEKDDVAAILNRDFVAIKVDREERPDVDAIHMAAVQGISGRGGWPLSVFLTPDGQPFWGTTFLPRSAFKKVLSDISRMWHEDRENVLKSGAGLTSWLKGQGSSRAGDASPANETLKAQVQDLITKAVEEFESNFDPENGGFGGAPKFPPAMALMFLLRASNESKAAMPRQIVSTTLGRMARGGIHDHVGGGFHRYATDEGWLIPHFEKMLYDNALLTVAYCDAWQVLIDDPARDEFRRVALRTLDYIVRDMRLPESGFASAEDADSEKAEGKFYVWSWDELKEILKPDDFLAFCKRYNILPHGNFEFETHAAELEAAAGLKTLTGMNIPHLANSAPLSDASTEAILDDLLATRTKRIRPLRDDKILAGWNGLVLAALARGAATFGGNEHIKAAIDLAGFIEKNFHLGEGELVRCPVKDGRHLAAQLEDYAFVIWGLLEIYTATGTPKYLDLAVTLQAGQDRNFWDGGSGNYHDAPADDETLLFRPKSLWDQATPSGNSVTATNLLRLSRVTLDQGYEISAVKVLASAWADLCRHPRGFPWMMMAANALVTGKNHVGDTDGTNYFCSIDGCEPKK